VGKYLVQAFVEFEVEAEDEESAESVGWSAVEIQSDYKGSAVQVVNVLVHQDEEESVF
jgi:hypothetical protein